MRMQTQLSRHDRLMFSSLGELASSAQRPILRVCSFSQACFGRRSCVTLAGVLRRRLRDKSCFRVTSRGGLPTSQYPDAKRDARMPVDVDIDLDIDLGLLSIRLLIEPRECQDALVVELNRWRVTKSTSSVKKKKKEEKMSSQTRASQHITPSARTSPVWWATLYLYVYIESATINRICEKLAPDTVSLQYHRKVRTRIFGDGFKMPITPCASDVKKKKLIVFTNAVYRLYGTLIALAFGDRFQCQSGFKHGTRGLRRELSTPQILNILNNSPKNSVAIDHYRPIAFGTEAKGQSASQKTFLVDEYNEDINHLHTCVQNANKQQQVKTIIIADHGSEDVFRVERTWQVETSLCSEWNGPGHLRVLSARWVQIPDPQILRSTYQKPFYEGPQSRTAQGAFSFESRGEGRRQTNRVRADYYTIHHAWAENTSQWVGPERLVWFGLPELDELTFKKSKNARRSVQHSSCLARSEGKEVNQRVSSYSFRRDNNICKEIDG
ncbi:hypothetical protein BDY19DRAFT_1046582 [Irpex rosettiformis]|uniref:Uncharacterized protein n=1 Tax=Irpex rosettiformis TaxID=378272 RepID=A0ACB8UBM4_9APHY|nr:hypothetical protein BDY19DRAFT_1046582 [Irpex rosettiformis]